MNKHILEPMRQSMRKLETYRNQLPSEDLARQLLHEEAAKGFSVKASSVEKLVNKSCLSVCSRVSQTY